jgi:hypothetical protein
MATKKFSDYAIEGQNVTLTYDNINDTVTFDVVVDKNDVGLGNVDNTSDANKPVSTAQQTALNLKQNNLVSGTNIKTVNSNTLLGSGDLVIDKTSVGLGNVANVDTTNATNITSGTLADTRLTANVTTQGNTFNTANKLVQLDGTAKLPAIDGSQLTNLPTPTLAQVTTAGNTTTNAITVGKLNVINTSTTIAPVVISGTNPFSGGSGVDYFVINGTGNVGTTLKTDVGGYVAHRFYGNNVELGVFYVGETNKEFVFKNSSTGYIDFQTTTSSTSRVRIFNNGNVGINTTTDAGYKLDVNGTARVQGKLTVSTGGLEITGTSLWNSILSTNASTAFFNSSFFNSRDNFYGGGNFNLTSGYVYVFQAERQFQPTSGTATYVGFYSNPTINQTGGANGITRGLYVNPTLTAAADFRAIETTVGKVILGSTSGNVLIGTATDAGYKLDVNGSTRIKGAGSSQSTTAFIIQNSSGSQLFKITDDGATTIGAGNQGFNAVNGTINNYLISRGTNGNVFGTYTSFAASAIVQCDSTTRGFLPPRMTTTQKNAITSPASGLVVYDTTLGKLCVYGASSWETITST